MLEANERRRIFGGEEDGTDEEGEEGLLLCARMWEVFGGLEFVR